MPNPLPDKYEERDLRVRRTPRVMEVLNPATPRKSGRQIEGEDDLEELYFDDLKNMEGPDA
jgi:hypothetical protein